MPGHLRRLLGPTKARLIEYLDNGTTSINVDPNLSIDRKKEVLTELHLASVNQIRKIRNAISQIESYNKEWHAYIDTLRGEVKTAEEELYSSFADGDNGFLNVLLKGLEKIADLESLQAEIDLHLKKLQPPAVER